jgi:hypothetical protein
MNPHQKMAGDESPAILEVNWVNRKSGAALQQEIALELSVPRTE